MDDNAREDFIVALANVSSIEDSDDDTESSIISPLAEYSTVPPKAKDSTIVPLA